MVHNTADIVYQITPLKYGRVHRRRKKKEKLTFDIFHDHAQVPPGLKGAVHGHHERVLRKGEDVSLHKGLLYLIPQHQVLLVDLLHGKPLFCLLVPNQVHSSAK